MSVQSILTVEVRQWVVQRSAVNMNTEVDPTVKTDLIRIEAASIVPLTAEQRCPVLTPTYRGYSPRRSGHRHTPCSAFGCPGTGAGTRYVEREIFR